MTTATVRPLSDFWWLVLLRGVFNLIIGVLLVIAPGMSVVVLIQFLGILWLISGIFSIVAMFVGYSRWHWIWSLLSGVIGILAGVLVLNHPLLSAVVIPTVLVIIVGIIGIIQGVFGLIETFRGAGWWGIVWGGINLIIGLLLLSSPLIAATVLVVVTGITTIIGGLILTVYALRIRRG